MSGACLVTLNPSTPPRHAAIAAAHLNGQHLVQSGWRGEAETGAPVSVVIVPGWRNSGPGHWQSLWAARIAGAVRVEQEDWLQPHRSPWVASVEEAIAAAPHPVILVAHSLGCIASVHAVEQLRSKPAGSIAGALFVAPADPERRALFEDFTPVPANPLPFASIVAASSNDPYCPIRMASAYAKSWGSTFVRVPSAGHINVESGHGEWPLGWALLGALAALAPVQAHSA
ncbi:alpha/beta hydrolase [Comamonas sp.]|uniref:RBBP9/YdeN family alpha/beta hydrolase n=1 Tax=Comamonas sp. TaxID=34028 RepID=UPI00289BB7E1|nr:alpha/beta hydrolase [Comamonas sp.]